MYRTIIISLFSIWFGSIFGQNNFSIKLSEFDKYWEISPGIYRVLDNGKIGVATSNKIVIPCEYQQVWNLSEKGYFRVLKNGKIGIYHLEDGVIIPPEFDQIWDFKDDRARVLKNGKIGYYGLSGELLIPCEYQQIWDIKNGMARCMRNGKIGYVNEAGIEFVPCEYQQIFDFEQGKARVLKNGKTGYINTLGVEIIPCEYQKVYDFNDNKARVLKNGRFGVIDTTGQIIIPPIYTKIWDFEGDSAKALLDGELVYIDPTGEITSNVDFDPSHIHEIDVEMHADTESDTVIINNQNRLKSIDVSKEDSAVIFKIAKKKVQLNQNNESVSLKLIDEKKKRKRKFYGHLAGVDLGYNGYFNSDFSTYLPQDQQYLSLYSLKSIGFSLYPFQENINLIRSGNLGIVTGVGLEFNNYRFDNPDRLIVDGNGDLSYEPTDPSRDVLKNKLATLYATLPILLEFHTNYRSGENPFYFNAGVVGGVKLKSHTKIVYNETGDKDKVKMRDDFNLNLFRYGVMVRTGYRFINLYATYYLTPLFNGSNDPELYPFSAGISMYIDWDDWN